MTRKSPDAKGRLLMGKSTRVTAIFAAATLTMAAHAADAKDPIQIGMAVA